MYYPIQIPYILNQEFSQNMQYSEADASACGGFVICFWKMTPSDDHRHSVNNIIVADGCIDLVAGYDDKTIGFSGMSRTDFNFGIEMPKRYIGARLMPGAFHQLSGLPASAAMDTFLPLEAVFPDFDREYFFSLAFEQADAYFKQFLHSNTISKRPDDFTLLFNNLSQNPPATANELYQQLHFSARQCQRLFAAHYSITPKMALSIIRFQKCLTILTSPQAKPADIMNITGYYDQPHFIKDFKSNIGITPLELIRIYQT